MYSNIPVGRSSSIGRSMLRGTIHSSRYSNIRSASVCLATRAVGVNGLLKPQCDGDEMGTVMMQMGRSTSFQVDLTAASSAIRVNFNDLKHLPNSARELLEHHASFTTTSFHDTMPQGEAGLELAEALHFYPSKATRTEQTCGNLATRSPPGLFRRQMSDLLVGCGYRARLPKDWVDLLAVDDLPLEQDFRSPWLEQASDGNGLPFFEFKPHLVESSKCSSLARRIEQAINAPFCLSNVLALFMDFHQGRTPSRLP